MRRHPARTALPIAVTLAFSACVARAQPTFDFLPRMVGIAIGVTPQWSGAENHIGGFVPGARYKFDHSERYVEWYGPLIDANLVESPTWQLGPALNFRFGRSDVEDEVVRLLPDVASTIEGGLIASYSLLSVEPPIPFRLRIGVTLMGDLGHTYAGLNCSTFANVWLPFSRKVFFGIGGGFAVASADYNQTFYGVTPADSQASGLPTFTPAAGLRQWYGWSALVFELTPRWYGGAGVFYQRISGEVADSPIVTQRGSPHQLTAGMGIGYVW